MFWKYDVPTLCEQNLKNTIKSCPVSTIYELEIIHFYQDKYAHVSDWL